MRNYELSISLLTLGPEDDCSYSPGIGFSLAEVDKWSAGLRAIATARRLGED